MVCNGELWYLHVDWVFDEPVVIKNFSHRPKRITMRRNSKNLTYAIDGDRLVIHLSQHKISLNGEIIEIEWQ